MTEQIGAPIVKVSSRAATYAMIGGLYVIQGIPLGFSFEAVPTLLRHAGTSLETLAFAPIVALPWLLKVFWAPVVENRWSPHVGRRRSWIIPMQAALALSLGTIAFLPINNENAFLIIALATLASLFAATQDVAVDALAAERLTADDMGDANGLQVGGLAAGMLLGGAGTLVAIDTIGQPGTLLTLALCVLVGLVPILLWQEPATGDREQKTSATVSGFFSRPYAASAFALGLIATLSGTVLYNLWRLILIDAGWTLSAIGVVGALGNTGVMLIGSAIAALLIRALGFSPVGTFGLAGVVVAGITWIFVLQSAAISSPVFVTTLIVFGSFCAALASVVIFGLVMKYVRTGTQPGTDFTLFQSSHTLGGAVVSSLAIGISSQLGYTGGLLVGIFIGLSALGIFVTAGRTVLEASHSLERRAVR